MSTVDLLDIGLNALGTLSALLLALYLSPRLADRKSRRDQQERVLRILLNTWITPANSEYQSAIGVILLDFKGCKDVLHARADMLAETNKPWPEDAEEGQVHQRVIVAKQANLISAIAAELGYEMSADDLLAGVYVTKGFVDRENLLISAMIAWQRIANALERSNELITLQMTGAPADEQPPSETD